MQRSKIWRLLALALLVALVGAACDSGGDSDDSAAEPAAANEGDAGGAEGDGAAEDAPNACDVVTDEEATELLGAEETLSPAANGTGLGSSCTWVDGANTLLVTVLGGTHFETGNTTSEQVSELRDVENLGDDAYVPVVDPDDPPDQVNLAVLVGDVNVNFTYRGDIDQDALIELARTAVGRM